MVVKKKAESDVGSKGFRSSMLNLRYPFIVWNVVLPADKTAKHSLFSWLEFWIEGVCAAAPPRLQNYDRRKVQNSRELAVETEIFVDENIRAMARIFWAMSVSIWCLDGQILREGGNN